MAIRKMVREITHLIKDIHISIRRRYAEDRGEHGIQHRLDFAYTILSLLFGDDFRQIEASISDNFSMNIPYGLCKRFNASIIENGIGGAMSLQSDAD